MLLHFNIGCHFTKISRSNITPQFCANTFVRLNFV
jgi:hypothetical protein